MIFQLMKPGQEKIAIMRRRPGNGLMIHSDRGVQYASKEFKSRLKDHGFIQSICRKGDCWDNAVAESFSHTIKTQLIHHVRFKHLKRLKEFPLNILKCIITRDESILPTAGKSLFTVSRHGTT